MANSPNFKNARAQDTRSGKFQQDKYQINEHVYPNDLLSNTAPYGFNYVVFYINVSEDSRAVQKAGGKNQFVEDIDPRISSVAQETKLSPINAAVGVFGQNAVAGGALGGIHGTLNRSSYSETLRNMAAGARGAVWGSALATTAVWTQALDFERSKKRLKTAIMLHMPNELRFASSVVWGEHDLKNFMLGADGFDALGTAIKSLSPWSDPKIKDSFNQLGAGAAALALSAPNTQGLQSATGLAPNPKKEMLFNSVNFREFKMNYQFFPKNPAEAQKVRNIIEEFRYHQHPEYKDAKKFLYLYPSEFDIYFYHRDEENRNINRVTSCALTNVETDYTPNGMFNTLSDGMPPQVNVSLTFKELAVLSKAEIEQGY